MKKYYAVWWPWLVLLFPEIFFAVQASMQMSTASIFEPIRQDFAATAFSAALLSSAYYYMYVGFQTPAGIIMDNYGPRRLLSAGALVCGVSSIVFAQTSYYPLALFAKFCMGGGAAFAFVGILHVIRTWFPSEKHSFLIGLTEVFAMVGSIRGVFLLSFILKNFDWRMGMLVFGLYFLVAGLGCWCFVRDQKPAGNQRLLKKPVRQPFWQSLMAVFCHRLAWMNGLYIGLMFSVATVFAALWATPFLMLHLAVSAEVASKITLMTYIGIAVGCPLYGLLSEKYKKRRPFLIFSGLSSLLFFSAIIYGPAFSITIECIEMFSLGLLISGYILSFSISDDISPDGVKNTYIGFTNACCLLTAPILQPLIGGLLDWQATHPAFGTMVHHQNALAVMFVVLLAATLLAWFMPETFKQPNN